MTLLCRLGFAQRLMSDQTASPFSMLSCKSKVLSFVRLAHCGGNGPARQTGSCEGPLQAQAGCLQGMALLAGASAQPTAHSREAQWVQGASGHKKMFRCLVLPYLSGCCWPGRECSDLRGMTSPVAALLHTPPMLTQTFACKKPSGKVVKSILDGETCSTSSCSTSGGQLFNAKMCNRLQKGTPAHLSENCP